MIISKEFENKLFPFQKSGMYNREGNQILFLQSMKEKLGIKSCCDYIVPEKFTEQVRVYNIMKGDILTAISAVEELIKLQDSPPKESLFLPLCYLSTMVMLYGRCFARSKGSKSLDFKKCYGNGDQKFLRIHKRLISLRNQYIAHRENRQHDDFILFALFEPGHKSINPQVVSSKFASPPKSDLLEYKLIFEYLYKAILCPYFDKAVERSMEAFTAQSKEDFSACKIDYKKPGKFFSKEMLAMLEDDEKKHPHEYANDSED